MIKSILNLIRLMAFATQTVLSVNSINQKQAHNGLNSIPPSIKYILSHTSCTDMLFLNLFYIFMIGFLCFLIFGLGIYKDLGATIVLTTIFMGLIAMPLFVNLKFVNIYFEKVQTRKEFEQTLKRIQNNDAYLILLQQIKRFTSKGRQYSDYINKKKIELESLNHQNQSNHLEHLFISNQQNQLFLFDYEAEISFSSKDMQNISILIDKYKLDHSDIINRRSKLIVTYQIQGVNNSIYKKNNPDEASRKDKLRKLAYIFTVIGLSFPYMFFFDRCLIQRKQVKVRKILSLK